MLRFIAARHRPPPSLPYFNTSNVTVHPERSDHPPYRTLISIHPMLRFIRTSGQNWTDNIRISIHPMLRFIHFRRSQPGAFRGISIHPMLRFIREAPVYGKTWELYFNTSNVTVHLRTRLKHGSHFRISIHPMLRFIYHFIHVVVPL